jgi:hypothetical protein
MWTVTKWILGQEAKQLLDDLYRGAKGSKRDRARTLQRIGELGGAAAIPRLAGFLKPSNRKEAAAALQAIASLLDSVQPSQLRRLDLEIRRQAPYWGFGRLAPEDVARLRVLSSEPFAAAAICSMHRSGYVREAALRELALRRDARELPFLLLRAADWVDEIRTIAQEALTGRLTASYVEPLVSCLALVEGESFATGRGRALRPAIDSLLADPRSADALLHGLTASDRPSRRAAARRLAQLGTARTEIFLEAALQQDDVVVTTIAADSALRAFQDGELWALLLRLRDHPIGRLRQMALWTSVSQFPAKADEMLREALFDGQGGVRDIAQRQLSSQGVNVPDIYREAMAVAPKEALLGLAEVGGKDDVLLAEPYLRADIVSLRRAALRAVARLDPAGNRDALLDGLADPSPSVSREALRGLASSAGAVAEDVWRICLATDAAHVRRNCFRLFASLGKWDLLRWGLVASLRPEPDIVEAGRSLVDRALARWNTSFTTPSPQILEEIASLASRAEVVLDRKTYHHLQFTLSGYVSQDSS